MRKDPDEQFRREEDLGAMCSLFVVRCIAGKMNTKYARTHPRCSILATENDDVSELTKCLSLGR